MDPATVLLKVYKKSLDGVLEILKEISWRVADDNSKESILKTMKKDLKDLCKDLEEYEKELISS